MSIRSIHERLGTAGFIISIIALVAALGGSAFAAKGALTHKQKKEVAKIAKKEAKKYAGKPGPAGAQGPAGPAGPAGAKGEPGAAGKDGTNGTNGKGVLATENPAACGGLGGVELEVEGSGSKKTVCNGEEGEPGQRGPQGSPWTDGGTLPSEATETGAWGVPNYKGSPGWVDISFNIPLAAALDSSHVLFEGVGYNGENEECPGTAVNPEAKKGYLCVYQSEAEGVQLSVIVPPQDEVQTLEQFLNATQGSGTTGAKLAWASGAEESHAAGTWALTAP